MKRINFLRLGPLAVGLLGIAIYLTHQAAPLLAQGPNVLYCDRNAKHLFARV